MPQVLDHYGIERNRANRIRCVLHNGQDFNCGIKDHYIHCFVCGQSADVIKFVQVYFGLDFQSAISKLTMLPMEANRMANRTSKRAKRPVDIGMALRPAR